MTEAREAPWRRFGRRWVWVLGLGAAVIAGLWALPIREQHVAELTLQKLGRELLAQLRSQEEIPWAQSQFEGPYAEALQASLVRSLPSSPPAVEEGSAEEAPSTAPAQVGPLLHWQSAREGPLVQLKLRHGERLLEAQARVGSASSLLPPAVALVVAIGFHQVLIALLLAVLVGAIVLHDGAILSALWAELSGIALAPVSLVGADVSPGGHIGQVLADTFNLQILAFTFALVGMVGVIGRIGGTQGLVNALSRFVRGPRSAQAVTSAMGTAIFFDDYANTVVVGTTARALTDAHRVSREKLAYLVDSTSAPIAGVAIVSTWIGYEVGLFDDLLSHFAGMSGMPSSGYELFFQIMPLRFYCLFAIALIYINAWTGRDFRAMRAAEERARAGGPLSLADPQGSLGAPTLPAHVRPRALDAVLPIGVVLAAIFFWILLAGSADLPSVSVLSLDDWKAIFASEAVSDGSATILLGSALLGCVAAFALALGRGVLSFGQALAAFWQGMKTLIGAAGVLILAWSIKSVCDDLGTGLAIVALVDGSLPPSLLPLTIFLLSGVVAFSTGTSWGTMALVLPVAAPLAVALSGEPAVVLLCMGAVLDGAIFGDHCSPISDTTVLSSTATGCPLMDHIRTQLPYALTAMVIAGALGYYGVIVGLPLWAAYLLGLALLWATLRLFARPVRVGGEPAMGPLAHAEAGGAPRGGEG